SFFLSILLPPPRPTLFPYTTLFRSVRHALGETFVGAYLQGSFAVGDFDQHSDVDFIVAVRDELTERQVADLQIVHVRIHSLECKIGRAHVLTPVTFRSRMPSSA